MKSSFSPRSIARRTGLAATALAAMLVAGQPAMLVADAAPRVRTQAGRPGDTTLIVKGTPEAAEFAHQLGKLIGQRTAGVPFEVHELELLDIYEANLPLARIEVETLLSRAIYQVYVAGKQPTAAQADLLTRYHQHRTTNALDLHSRKMLLNAGSPDALGRTGPDGLYSWEMYSNPELYNQLSGAAQRVLQARYGRIGRVPVAQYDSSNAERPEVTPSEVLVNNPAADATAQDTQSETSIVLLPSNVILASWNDSGSFIGVNRFTGTGRSTDLGDTWTDQGVIQSPTADDAGDPVFARRNSDGRVILSTLEFTNLTTVQMFRSDTAGVSYQTAVGSAVVRSGDQHDKNWITADNFGGSGMGDGNFYLAWRNFSGTAARSGITFMRSTDGGGTWGSETVIELGGQGAWPVVGADHAVYVFHFQSGPNRIRMRKSTTQGTSFAAAVTVATMSGTGSNGDLALTGGLRSNSFPQVVAHPTDPNRLYVVYNDRVAGNANIFFTQTADGGSTWSTPVVVNDDAGTADQWQPVLAISPDGTRLFVSWYDRRLSAPNIDVFGTVASVSGGTVTFGPNFRINSQAFPVVIGQDPQINATYMGDYDQALADSTNFYRTWGDNRGSSSAHTNQPDVRFTKIPLAGPGPILSAQGSSIISEACTPTNGGIDPGEMVTVGLTVRNAGTSATSSLVGTLQATGGVTSPGAPQNYGAIPVGGMATQNFTFTASSGLGCGAPLVLSLQLQDGATNQGTVTYNFVTGTPGPTTTASYSSGDIAVPILDNATATSTINVPDTGFATDVNVSVRLNHTWDADVTLVLQAPDSSTVTLSAANGGSNDNYGTGTNNCSGTPTVFDDSAATPITAGAAPFAGTFQPQSPLSAFNGKAVNGTWTLRLSDSATGDTGTLGCWSMTIGRQTPLCTTPCPSGGNIAPVANAGSNQTVNSCTIVTLNGTGSTDPDSGPNPLTYSWMQTGGPTVVINNPTSATATFESPNVASSSNLMFQLTVNDGAAMNSASTQVTVNHVSGVHADTTGLYTPSTFFLLRNCNGPGGADLTYAFGASGWIPLRGDWDGDGDETQGAFDPVNRVFYLKNTHGGGSADITVAFGAAGDLPVVGDWDGNGTVTIGLYRPSDSSFRLKNTNTAGAADIVFVFGAPGANFVPIVGDWDGNGTTTAGLYQTTSGGWFLINTNAAGSADLTFVYGPPAGSDWVPVVGNWDGIGGDSCGLFQRSTSFFWLKNTNSSGSADILFQFGVPVNTFTPMGGNWDGF